MKRTSRTFRRLLSLVLTGVLLAGAAPAVVLPAKAADAGQDYVSLPITIRDYADDGMLFDYNDENQGGTQGLSNSSAKPVLSLTDNYGSQNVTKTSYTDYKQYVVSSSGAYITYYINGTYTRDDLRYAVLRYRTTTSASSTPVLRYRTPSGDTYNDTNLSGSGYNSTSFVSEVIDTGGGSGTLRYITLFPRMTSGTIYIAEIAFFNNKADAQDYSSKLYRMGNNLHFGLLLGNPNTVNYNSSTYAYNGATFTGPVDQHMSTYLGANMPNVAAGSGTSSPGSVDAREYTSVVYNSKTWGNGSLAITLESGAKQYLSAGRARLGLVEPILGPNKQVIYKEKTVDYMAWLLQKSLNVPESENGVYNFNYVMGSKVFNDDYTENVSGAGTKDLAGVLREHITNGLGSYTATKASPPVRVTDIKTYYDAAYFLLHNTWDDNAGYGTQNGINYTEMQLIKTSDDEKGTYYVFNSGYSNTVYDNENGVIYNTQTTYTPGSTGAYGILDYDNRFDPVQNAGYGITGSRYSDLSGANKTYYDTVNFNHTLEGHAKFIYYHDADQFFTFTGDDDVYLYINDHLVMDMGGGHAASKITIYLSDLETLCGLEDGKAYDFDFYYMERHGHAANFSIETNIQIVDPAMLAAKEAYQNGLAIGYKGFVNPDYPVQYAFTLQNDGEVDLTNLTFDDNDIGVRLSPETVSLNDETKLSDLRLVRYNKDGSKKDEHTDMTETELKTLLSEGIKVGEKISIYGFSYTIPDNQWLDNAFPNTVYSTALATGNNTSTHTLRGIAEFVVQKHTYTLSPVHLYSWGILDGDASTEYEIPLKSNSAQPVTLDLEDDKLEQYITLETGATLSLSGSATLQLCNASGNLNSFNSKATLDPAVKQITYTPTKTGVDTFYYLIQDGNSNYGPIRVDVYTYGVQDNTYVLDYGLPVQLNFQADDLTSTRLNPNTTTASVTVSEATSEYGDFSYSGDTLTYTMDKFMNAADSIKAHITVRESGSDTAVTKYNGVVMDQIVTVVPASIMYYEDTFTGSGALEFTGDWSSEESGAAAYQSADPGMNYGSDPHYQQAASANASNGTVKSTRINQTSNILSFDFQGTGFDILSRTTQKDYAVLMVNVFEQNGSNEPVHTQPVIAQCTGGDLYQIPLLSVTGLTHGKYHVELLGAASNGVTARTAYLDGVRIYDPLSAQDAAKYYSPAEAAAKVLEIKPLIDDGTVSFAKCVFIENKEKTPVLIKTDNREDYLYDGPNNEVYLSRNENTISFYLKPIEGVSEEERTIQIGAHLKTGAGLDPQAILVYGSEAQDILKSTNSYQLISGTEQYYTIDPARLSYDPEKGAYQVLVGTSSSGVLSLTNLKLSGYTLLSGAEGGDPA